MKATVFAATCANGHTFAAPGLPDASYGQFILTSDAGGRAASVDALADETFAEVRRFVAEQGYPGDEVQRGALIRKLFAATCDLAPDGSSFRVDALPRCPTCKSQDLRTWAPAIPPVRVEVAEVTHARWRRLPVEERRRILEEAARANAQGGALGDLDAYLAKVRALVSAIADRLTPQECAAVEHLIDRGEPAEGLRTLAWIVVEERKRVPAEVVVALRALTSGLIRDEDMPGELDRCIEG